MPEVILISVVVITLGGILYWVCSKLINKTVGESTLDSEQEQSTLNNIIELVYHQAHSQGKNVNNTKVSKVLLMEQLNLRPTVLKRYLGKLTTKDILSEDQDCVKITPFGVAFFKMFGKDAIWRH